MVFLRILLRIASGYEVCGGLGSAGVACAVIAALTDPYIWAVIASGLVGAALTSLITRAIPTARRRNRKKIAQEMRELSYHFEQERLHNPMSVSRRHLIREHLERKGISLPDHYALPDSNEDKEAKDIHSLINRMIPFVEAFGIKRGMQEFLKSPDG